MKEASTVLFFNPLGFTKKESLINKVNIIKTKPTQRDIKNIEYLNKKYPDLHAENVYVVKIYMQNEFNTVAKLPKLFIHENSFLTSLTKL